MTSHFSQFFALFALATAITAACQKPDEPEKPAPEGPEVEVITLPTSVKLSEEGPLQLDWGTSLSISFTVSPESALEGLSLEQLQEFIRLEGSTGQPIAGYQLTGLSHSGSDFTATLEDTKSKGSYADKVVLLFAREDSKGRLHQIRSKVFEVVSTAFEGPKTGLPVVFIDTPDAQPIVSKEDWMDGVKLYIFDAD